GNSESDFDHLVGGSDEYCIPAFNLPTLSHIREKLASIPGLAPGIIIEARFGKKISEQVEGWFGYERERKRGDNSTSSGDAQQEELKKQASAISPKPFQWVDPQSIPPRPWLYGKLLIRKQVSADFAPGGTGKTSHSIVEALAMVSGKPLLGIAPIEPLKVWF